MGQMKEAAVVHSRSSRSHVPSVENEVSGNEN